MQNSTPVGRLAYLRIHAYGLFIGLIAVAVGARTLLEPGRSIISIELDRIPASLLVWSVLQLLGGLQILVGMIWRDLRAELVGLAFIAVATGWSTFGQARVFGATSSEARYAYVLLAVLLSIASLRASALLSRETLYVVYPGRRRPRAERTELILSGSAEPEKTQP